MADETETPTDTPTPEPPPFDPDPDCSPTSSAPTSRLGGVRELTEREPGPLSHRARS